jgi:tRNA G46 methylase TrmB|tara:strand:+ start:25 stop:600 length:576 start_codon:yes stop_codon:yes gene_type:complete
MEQRSQQMSSKKYTMDDVKQDEVMWKNLVVQNEITLLKSYLQNKDYSKPYDLAEKNAWIIRTLRDKKQRYKFTTCKNLVLIGSGMYPYSMFDVHRQYPNIKQIGIEIDKNRCVISKKLIAASPCKNDIKIVNIDAIDYDYSWLGIDDLIFISVDVESKKMIEKIIKTSKAQVNICAPYDKTWLRNLISSFS